MTDTTGDQGSDRARWMIVRQDRMALQQIVRDNGACEATGQWLSAADAVAMTVAVRPGVSRLAVVSGTHWDSGIGALSAADPDVDPDVLDGRKLFAGGGKAQPSGGSPSPEHRVRGAVPMQRPRQQVPEGTGAVPRI
jgi:hypothetical protein